MSETTSNANTDCALNANGTKRKPCEHCGTDFPYERSTAKFCSGACRKAFFDGQNARPPRQLEGSALLSVRARQQQKDIERAQVAARKAERTAKKKLRDDLKAENIRLAIEQQQNIEKSNADIAERFSQQAQIDLTNGILGNKIAIQDKQEGL